ncbi:MAG: DnaJ domain-containing protein [Pseudomonadales bacterium]|nr:DnaJ domain-containing protein [Pseudomonadales bacterium]
MDFKDYYKILGIEPNASQDEIKRSFKKLARKYHPDVSNEPDAQARFQEVSEAYEVLKDKDKRAEYDQLKDYLANGGAQSDQGFQFRQHQFGPGAGFEDILNTIFGGQGFGGDGFRGQDFGARGFGNSFGHGQSQPSADLHHNLDITLEEARHGGQRQLRLRTTQGEKTINVKIPAGITQGKELRLKGQGDKQSGTRQGDLYLRINILPHQQFRLDGNHVEYTLPVSPWEAALGESLEVPTLDGRVRMKIPAGSQTGNRLRLKNKGLGKDGDQYVVLRIVNPEISSDEQRAAFEKLKETFATFSARSGH